MMQKTSLNKIPLNIFLFTFKKNLGFSLVASILALLVSPIYLYSVITNYVEDYGKLIYNFENLFITFAALMAVAATAYMIVLLYINFNYLYNKSASDYFHALPLKRSSLLFSRFFASYLAALLPVTVGYIGTFALSFLDIVAANRTAIVEAYFFTVIMMAVLGLFTLLFIITAGGVFDSLLSLLAINIGIPLIVAYIYTLCEQNLYGFTYSADFDTSILSYTTPFGYAIIKLLLCLGDNEEKLFTAIRVFGMIDMLALFGALNVILYTRRKSEKLGGSYSFKFIPEIIGMIIAALGLFVFGYIFAEDSRDIVYWVAGTVGAVLAVVIYSLIINRGFKKVKKAIIVGVIASVVLIITNLGIKFDIFGWKYNLPEINDIQSVSVQSGGTDINVKNIQLALDFNNAIIREHDENHSENNQTNHFRITYALKNGKIVTRVYDVETSVAKDLKAKLVAEEYSRDINEKFNVFKNKKVEGWELTGYIYEKGEYKGRFDTIIDAEKAEELVNAYTKDLETYGDKFFDNYTKNALSTVLIEGRVIIKQDTQEFGNGTVTEYTDYENFVVSVENFETFKNVKAVVDTIDFELEAYDVEKY